MAAGRAKGGDALYRLMDALRPALAELLIDSPRVLLYDASSNRIRRERFAPFFHHPEMSYAVGVIPTRAGFHVTAGVNPWKLPDDGIHIGEIMEEYGGGGHRSVGGANPNGLDDARRVAEEIAVRIRTTVLSRASESGAGAS